MVRTATYFTLSQAAQATDKSKSVISKALKNGTLSHVGKDDSGYQIDPAELFRVFPKNAVLERERERSRTPERTGENDPENPSLISSLEVENKLLHARILDKEERISELKEERDHWKQEKDRWHETAQRLMLTYQPAVKAPQESVEAQSEGAGQGDSKKAETDPPEAKKSMIAVIVAAALVAGVATAALQTFQAEIRAGMDRLLGSGQPIENGKTNETEPAENPAKNAGQGREERPLEPLPVYPQSLPEPDLP